MANRKEPDEQELSRRQALLIALGKADRIALERDQQAAIDGARGYSDPDEPRPDAPDDLDTWPLWLLVGGLAAVAIGVIAYFWRRSAPR